MAVLTAVCVLSEPAGADTIRYVISMGNQLGYADEPTLRFAIDDATRMKEVLDDLSAIPPERVFLLENKSIPDLEDTVDRVARLAATHPGRDVVLVFYFSGHGDERSLHIGSKDLTMKALVRLLRKVPANRRIALVDACRSGPDPDVLKGAGVPADVPKGPHVARASVLAAPHAGPSDLVLIRSSGTGEAAQESDELMGGVFTHYLVNGLRGPADVDGDRRVTLGEAFDYAQRYTRRRGQERGQIQRPTAGTALRAHRTLALSDPTKAEATIVVPARARTRYRVFALPKGRMVAEGWTTLDRPVRIAVQPGRYVVQRENRTGYAAAEVNMPWGGESTLRHGDFESRNAISLSALSRARSTRHHELTIGYGGAMTGDAIGHGARLRYGYRFERVAMTFGVDLGLGLTTVGGEARDRHRLAGDFRVEWRGRFDPIELRLGAGARVAVLRETVDGIRSRRVAYGPTAAAELHVPLTGRWGWRISMQATALLTRKDDSHDLRPGLLATTGPAWEW